MTVARKLACRVERIIHHGEHVYTVDLRPERPAPRFRPGQFLHLALDPYDPSGFWPESRVFSIASPPTQRERLRITYAVQGHFTARMERELAEGQWVWVKLPYGEFVVEDTRDAVLFAGGTGITAFTAFLAGLTHESQHAVYLAYGARQRGLLIYRDMVEQRAQITAILHAFYFIESEAGELQPHEATGRLSVDAIWPRISNPSEAIYYISGPPLMLKTITQDLRGQGIRADAIRIDAWA
jgi:ferredoxin-NADP reductase